MGRWAFLASVVGLSTSFCSGAAGGDLDPNRFFRAISEAETISERLDLCAQLSLDAAPPYAILFCQGLTALSSGSDSLAARLLYEALRAQPDFALGCVAYADAYAEHERWGPAITWYERARTIAPNRLDPYYGLGRAWLVRGATEGAPAYEKALEAFREMTRIAPSNPDGWGNVGMALATLGRFDDAEKSYRKALGLAPKDPQIYESLGSLASRRGDDSEAESLWKKALEITPSQAAAATELAALYGRQGKIGDAIGVLEKGVEAAHVGLDAGRLRRDLALLSLLEDQTPRAAALLEEARVLNPDARTLASLAHVRMLGGRTDEALPLLADAAGMDSAVTGPFVQAWSDQLEPAIGPYAAANPAGAAVLQRLLSIGRSPSRPTGAAASPSLVRLLLPEWKLPEGRLHLEGSTAALPYDVAPVPVYRALASYPEAALGIEGTILVRVHVDTQGQVRDAKIIEGGNPALEWAAMDAARRWRFQPATRNGQPVEAEVTIPFRFSSTSH